MYLYPDTFTLLSEKLKSAKGPIVTLEELERSMFQVWIFIENTMINGASVLEEWQE